MKLFCDMSSKTQMYCSCLVRYLFGKPSPLPQLLKMCVNGFWWIVDPLSLFVARLAWIIFNCFLQLALIDKWWPTSTWNIFFKVSSPLRNVLGCAFNHRVCPKCGTNFHALSAAFVHNLNSYVKPLNLLICIWHFYFHHLFSRVYAIK